MALATATVTGNKRSIIRLQFKCAPSADCPSFAVRLADLRMIPVGGLYRRLLVGEWKQNLMVRFHQVRQIRTQRVKLPSV